MSMSDFTRADYWRIKWPLLLLLISCAAVVSATLILRTLNADAQRALSIARSDFDQARQSVDKLAEEEATAIEYLGRYDTLSKARIMGAEDRLQFIESLARLRAENNLFPIQMSMSGQKSFTLPYAAAVREPGRPVQLHQSNVDISMALLHENDLMRLLDAIISRPDLVQARSCELKANGRSAGSYVRLGQHFSATCTLQWLTFAVDESAGAAP